VLLTFRGEYTRFENPEDRNLGNRAPMDDFGGEIRGSKINGEDNDVIPPIDNGPLPF
jgi:replicative DNA helicase